MSDNALIQSVLDRYVEAVTSGNVPQLSSIFRDDAHMWGHLGDELLSAPIGAFFEVVAGIGDSARFDGYRSSSRAIEVNGTVATAILEETNFLGQDFVNCFSLVREGGQWLIVSKTFQGAPS